MSRHIMLNSKILPSNEFCLTYNNRGLLWGDSFHVELRGNSYIVYNFKDYFDCINDIVNLLGMEKDQTFNANIIQNDIYLLLQKNRIYKEFSVNICIFRNSNNTQKISQTNTFSVLLSVEAINHEFYQLNKDKNGLFVSTLPYSNLAENKISEIINPKFKYEYLCADMLSDFDDFIIADSNNYLKRSIYSNIFFIKNQTLITTDLSSLSTNNTFAKRIIEIAKKLKFTATFTDITEDKIDDMDEMFLADPINGIRWVAGFKKKRFYCNKIKNIAYELNSECYDEIKRLKPLRKF